MHPERVRAPPELLDTVTQEAQPVLRLEAHGGRPQLPPVAQQRHTPLVVPQQGAVGLPSLSVDVRPLLAVLGLEIRPPCLRSVLRHFVAQRPSLVLLESQLQEEVEQLAAPLRRLVLREQEKLRIAQVHCGWRVVVQPQTPQGCFEKPPEPLLRHLPLVHNRKARRPSLAETRE